MKTISIIILLFISNLIFAQEFSGEYLSIEFYNSTDYQELRNEIISVVDLYYKATEQCDLESLEKVLHEDFRYLHDLGGYYHSKEKILSIRRNRCKQKQFMGRGHNSIPGTVKVSPISTFGAVLTQRVVYNDTRFSDGAIFELGTVDHIFEFVKTNQRWQISRLYSIDHHPDFNGNQANRERTNLETKILNKYLGTYKMSDDVECQISKEEGVLKATFITAFDKSTNLLIPENDSTFFEKDKWNDWVYRFHLGKDGVMNLTILLNSTLYSNGERNKK